MTPIGSGTLFGLMDDKDFRKRAHEWAERTAIEQGLPPKIEDEVVIRRVLILMGLLDTDGRPIKPLK